MKQLVALVSIALLISCNNANHTHQHSATESGNSEIVTLTEPAGNYPTSITIKGMGKDMSEMKFDLSKIVINKGKTIKMTLINEGDNSVMTHNFVVVKNGMAEKVAITGAQHKDNGYVAPNDENVIYASPIVEYGQTKTFQFSVNEKGTYQFICSYPGHFKLMSGYLVVVD